MKCSHTLGYFLQNIPLISVESKRVLGQKKTKLTKNCFVFKKIKTKTLHTESPQIKSLVVRVSISDVTPCTSTSNRIPILNKMTIKPHESALHKEGICYLECLHRACQLHHQEFWQYIWHLCHDKVKLFVLSILRGFTIKHFVYISIQCYKSQSFKAHKVFIKTKKATRKSFVQRCSVVGHKKINQSKMPIEEVPSNT